MKKNALIKITAAVALMMLMPLRSFGFARAIWVWSFSTYVSAGSGSDERNLLFNLCREQNIHVLFGYYPSPSSGNSSLRNLIQEAHCRNIKVYCMLDSTPEDPPTASEATTWANNFVAYNNAVSASERFDGVQTDIEINSSSTFQSANVATRATMASNWLNIHKIYVDIIHASYPDAQVGPAFNCNLDILNSGSPVMATFNGVYKPWYQHTADICDYIAFMSYRPTASGICSLLDTEAAYCEQVGCDFMSGVETGDAGEANVSFLGQSYADLESAISQVESHYITYDYYLGMALHSIKNTGAPTANPSYEDFCGFYDTSANTSPCDSIAPPAVTGFVVNNSNGTLKFSWQNPSASDFSFVRIIYRTTRYPASENDGIAIYEGGAESFTYSPGTTESRYYAIVAVDTSGNASELTTQESAAEAWVSTLKVSNKICVISDDYSSYVCFKTTDYSAVSVVIYDIYGREVAELDSSDGDATWDGTDSRGADVPAGAYFYFATYGSGKTDQGAIVVQR